MWGTASAADEGTPWPEPLEAAEDPEADAIAPEPRRSSGRWRSYCVALSRVSRFAFVLAYSSLRFLFLASAGLSVASNTTPLLSSMMTAFLL